MPTEFKMCKCGICETDCDYHKPEVGQITLKKDGPDIVDPNLFWGAPVTTWFTGIGWKVVAP